MKRLLRLLVSFLKDLWAVLWLIPVVFAFGLFSVLLIIAVGSEASSMLRKLGRRL